MSRSTAKSVSKKKSASKKSAAKKVMAAKSKNGNGKSAKTNPLHDKLMSLFTRKEGATMHDTWNAGYKYPAMQALKIAERHGLKVSVKKENGEMTRYFAKR